MSEWQELKLGEVLNLKRGYDLTRRERIDGSIPVYSSSGISGFHNEAKANAPGVVTGRYGTIGKIFLAKTPFWPHNTTLYVEDFKGNDEIFIYYFLQQLNWEQFNDKSAVPGINRNDAHQADVTLPPLPEQRAIAGVLAALDDKIDLLHRQNRTLESLAQALFRHWFIDGAGADWEEGCLADFSENVRDSVSYGKIPNCTAYVGLEHIDKKNIALSQNGLSDEIQSNKYAFQENDILFGKLRPYFHKVCFASFSGVCSTDILVLRPKKPFYFCFSLFAFFQSSVVEYANLGSGGTRMPRTNWGTLGEYPMLIPPESLISQFDEMTVPSIEKIKRNLDQIRTLAALRDTLLPKLMSGEVRVRG